MPALPISDAVASRTLRMRQGLLAFLFRLPRRIAWAGGAVAVLAALYYPFENWRSAHALAAARERLIARFGSDDPMVLAPALIPEADNYSMNRAISAWRTSVRSSTGDLVFTPTQLMTWDFPKMVSTWELPGFRLPPVRSWREVHWSALEKGLAKHGMKPLPGESCPAMIDRVRGDEGGLLKTLAEGLDLPHSVAVPQLRELLASARSLTPDDAATIAEISNCSHILQALGLRLRAAALAGNGPRTRDLALIVLRISEGIYSHGDPRNDSMDVMSSTLADLQPVLARPVWDESTLTRLQSELAKFDDIQVCERRIGVQLAMTTQSCEDMKRKRVQGRPHGSRLWQLMPESPREPRKWLGIDMDRVVLSNISLFLLKHGPSGIYDANLAAYLNFSLDALGPPDETAWLDASAREKAVMECIKRECGPASFRTALARDGKVVKPAFYQINYAKNAFQRRCLIIACALEKHRLKHGNFPADLSPVQRDLASFKVTDVARAGNLMRYRLEPDGYLLWSAGPDATDDGGDDEKDWLWQMRQG